MQHVRALISGLVLSLMCGCAALSKPATGPTTPSFRDEPLLESSAATLLVEVDYLRGSEPRPRALRILSDRLAFYCDKPGGIEILVDDEVPAEAWQPDPEVIRELILTHADERPEEGAWLYVLYAPSWKRYRGYSFRVGRLGDDVDFPAFTVFTDQLRPILWLTGVRQEASVAVHEAGHVLGLVTNDDHRDGGHCTNAWCLMYDGVDARSLAVHLFPTLFTGYLPTHLCRDCREDLWPDGRVPGQRRLAGMPTEERPGCDPIWKDEP
jgi:hypothetical protein